MTDHARIDSPPLSASPASNPEAEPHRNAGTPAGLAPAAKKPRRPRPTFDDGALTRTFKFPSKIYPRSTYYVTSEEIIIRIKKARKKWKLVVPKKRVVSYRTNRWFAKPRWVAIELTYTQAVKLGLVEARPRTPDVVTEPLTTTAETPGLGAIAFAPMAPEPPVAHVDVPAEPATLQGDADAFEAAGEAESEADDADDFRVADDLDADDPELAAPLDVEPPMRAERVEPGPPPVLATQPVREQAPAEAQAPAENAPTAVVVPLKPRRRPLRHVATALAAGLAGFAIWTSIDRTPLDLEPECRTSGGQRCSGAIVTGSIAPVGTPAVSATEQTETAPISKAQAEAVAREELAAQDVAAAVAPAAMPEKQPDARAPAALPLETAAALALPVRDFTLPASPPAIEVSMSVPEAPPESKPFVACATLASTSREVLIRFDYGRSQFDAATVPALAQFAEQLKRCDAVKVTIEGHTDSDGSANANRSLSLRRAQAVRDYLVAVGVGPSQLSEVGFGRTRPKVPNTSSQNKRDNRRVVLVVMPGA